ncbi:hypothetical protein B0H14DRAFT_3603109 [Mycena olivaceomarginata]|nr:hypothetical protein B0H14DRAFT_3603109 [Mycena olivaceomarginata]
MGYLPFVDSSSGSFSLLPAKPKIFNGQEAELASLIRTLLADPAHVAILGPGGMGKTTLAVAALHDTKVTMRGAERPSKVQWSHPFLPPLRSLTSIAAHQTFIEIADEIYDSSEVDQLLEITDNIPLAVQLVATIAGSEGCQTTLQCWQREKTALLSADLLSLMSLLPDGISDTDLAQSKPPIPDILKCKTTLLRTSLAYVDHAGRSKITRPPLPHLVRPVRKHLNDLLKLWKSVTISSSGAGNLTPRLLSNSGNMHNLLVYGLDCDPADIGDTIQAIIFLNHFNTVMNRGFTPLMPHLQEMLPQIKDHRLHGQFIIEAFRAKLLYAIPNPDKYMDEAIEHFRIVNDIEGEAELYTMVARYYADNVRDHKKAQNLFHHALTLALQCDSHLIQVDGLQGLAIIECVQGTWSEGLRLSREIHRIAVAAGNLRGELNSCLCQAQCYVGLGDFKNGMQVVNQWKALILPAGIQGGESEFALLNSEAEIYYLRTEYAEARHVQEAILSHTSPVLSPVNYAFTLVNIVSIDIATGSSIEVILGNLHNAVDIFQRTHYPRGISLCEVHTADMNVRKGDTTGACDQYMHTFTSVYGADNELACYCLARLADSTNPVHAAPEVAKWAVIFLAFVMRQQHKAAKHKEEEANANAEMIGAKALV